MQVARNADNAESKAERPSTHSAVLIPRTSQYVLLGAGALAWVTALALALLGDAPAIGTAFVTAGFPLIGAGAFYGRIREFGPHGLKTDPLEAIGELRLRLPEPTGGSPAVEERARLLDAVEALLEDSLGTEEQPKEAPPSPPRAATAGASAYERAMALEEAVARWLSSEGFGVRRQSGMHDLGFDFLASRPGEVWVVELKARARAGTLPTPQRLRESFLRARVLADEDGLEGGFYRLLVTDVAPTAREIESYRQEGIGIAQVIVDSGRLKMYVSPRNAREESP
jgi:hypothetical protein